MTNEERVKRWQDERRSHAVEAKAERLKRAEARSKAAATARKAAAEEKLRREHEIVETLLPSESEIASEQLAVLHRRQVVQRRTRLRRLAFFGIPVFASILYSIIWLTPLYEATTTFSVTSGASAIGEAGGLALIGVPLGSGSAASYKVKEFLRSREAGRIIEETTGFLSSFQNDDVDFLTRPHRLPSLGIDQYDFYLTRVKVSIDVQSGLMTLRVQGISSEKAIEASAALLELARKRLATFNLEINTDQLQAVESSVHLARDRYLESSNAVLDAERALANVDDEQTSAAIYSLISELELELAEARSNREILLESGLTRSPLLPGLNSRMTALEAQIEKQKERLIGPTGHGTIAVNRTQLEDLVSQRELAVQNLQFAFKTYEDVRQRVLAQRLYLSIIAQPEAQSIPVFTRSALHVGVLSLLVGGLLIGGFEIIQSLRNLRTSP